MNTLFRALPSVDACLSALSGHDLPHGQLRALVQAFLEQRRDEIRAGRAAPADALTLDALLPALNSFVREGARPRLRRVLNATGVVIHTNLGRSVLAEEAVRAAALAAGGYCNLEYDLSTGGRGSRHSLVEGLVCELTGAEAAVVVNNNAAAVLLMLDTLCKGGEVVVSRGQLVEIGGTFRIPDVMIRSGAILREVGATNRTHLYDYTNAINENTRALLRVHTSNYRIAGFHADVPLEDMAALAREHNLPLLEDLGSGSFVDFTPWGLPGEPTARGILRAGADLVTFSGDKVLGGPQAGIIAGRADLIGPIRANQLMRALRCDKMTLAALEATLRLYLDPDKALARIPTLRRMTMSPAELRRRAQRLARALTRALPPDSARVKLAAGVSRVGGGSFPERDLPTTLVCVEPSACETETLRARLLASDPPLIGRIGRAGQPGKLEKPGRAGHAGRAEVTERDAFLLDPRTLEEHEFPVAARVMALALAASA